MLRTTVITITAVAALVVAAVPVSAGGEPEDSGAAVHVDKKGHAAGGADVVAYHSLEPGAEAVHGDEEHSYEWRGATWLFANERNLAAFQANPDKYAPAYGGYCAWAMARDDLATIGPDRWDIVDGRLYLNYNVRTQRRWREDRAADIDKADGNWPEWREKLMDR